MRTLRVLELYSGIGGMHCALTESCLPFEVILAIDINTTANKAYRHAFPATKLSECGIETLTEKQLDEWKIDMIVMSPPCQPFTRVGKKLDTEDLRTKSFLHLLSLLPRLTNCPSYILVENVKGFESSQTRDRLIETLHTCRFNLQECLLTPLQFGIPNSRLRYYLIAKRAPLKFCFKTTEKILDTIPSCASRWLSYKLRKRHGSSTVSGSAETTLTTDTKKSAGITPSSTVATDTADTSANTSGGNDVPITTISSNELLSQNCSNISGEGDKKGHLVVPEMLSSNSCLPGRDESENTDKYRALLKYGHNMRQLETDVRKLSEECVNLEHFLEQREPDYFNAYNLTDKELRRFIVMDIVHPCLTKTICFTKRYGHFMEGAGSIVQMTTDVEAVKRASEFKDSAMELQNRDEWGTEEISIIRALQLRYFTPREISNLLCFPQNYSFPEDLSRIQAYRLLGNSLNVHVVSVLLRMLVEGDT
ncbi:LOW QUALITY PROTEIN: tRNA (cytosine(38)-C(5))-methyltransferase-like [Pecten maximus]|uniref:LOW QUALITY PROTEIN: tRNA (cytosine(38)-C(5))-methyltransferase-like n=1 Tax=Pecten maximus TaxID=6579 RepID=UPI001458C366|nr:LOW QUALITY PROTEIN: tRNA (cytosine(38)-C(5))-methyltransferase-like [Pecten maximus]